MLLLSEESVFVPWDKLEGEGKGWIEDFERLEMEIQEN